MEEIYEPCSICEEYYIEGVICDKDKCPVAKMKAENEWLRKYYNDMESAICEFREDQAKVKFFKKEIKAEAITEEKEKLIFEIVNTPTRRQEAGMLYLSGVSNRQIEIIDIINGSEGKEMVGEE